jgi:hypothetical protein
MSIRIVKNKHSDMAREGFVEEVDGHLFRIPPAIVIYSATVFNK